MDIQAITNWKKHALLRLEQAIKSILVDKINQPSLTFSLKVTYVEWVFRDTPHDSIEVQYGFPASPIVQRFDARRLGLNSDQQNSVYDAKRACLVERVALRPPSFYTDGDCTIPASLDFPLALAIAQLGLDFGSETTVVEWNRVNHHGFNLATFIPAPNEKNLKVQVYIRISEDVAVRLVQAGIPTEIGEYSSDSWFDEQADKWVFASPSEFVPPVLEPNKAKFQLLIDEDQES